MDNQNNPTPQPQEPKSGGASWLVTAVIIVLIIAGGAYYYRQNIMPKDKQTQGTQSMPSNFDPDNDGDIHESGPENTEGGQPSVTPSATMTPTPTGAQGQTQNNQKVFTVEGSNFKFSPSQIKVSKGDKVKIVFSNTGGFHDFVIDEFNIKTDRLSGGQSATVEFTADKTGTFEYYCSVGEHRAMGMKGQLIVE